MNDDLWELYKEDFADFTEAVFKTCNPTNIRNLRTLLRHQGVWVSRDRNVTVPRALCNILRKEDPVEWSREDILEHIKGSGLFASFKLNRLSGIVDDPFDRIRDRSSSRVELTNQSMPDTQVTDQNTPDTQVTDRNTPEPQNTDRNPSVTRATNT